jgi:hypothetical protein
MHREEGPQFGLAYSTVAYSGKRRVPTELNRRVASVKMRTKERTRLVGGLSAAPISGMVDGRAANARKVRATASTAAAAAAAAATATATATASTATALAQLPAATIEAEPTPTAEPAVSSAAWTPAEEDGSSSDAAKEGQLKGKGKRPAVHTDADAEALAEDTAPRMPTPGEVRSIAQIDMRTSRIIQVHASAIDAARALNIDTKYAWNIKQVAIGQAKSAYGFKWTFRISATNPPDVDQTSVGDDSSTTPEKQESVAPLPLNSSDSTNTSASTTTAAATTATSAAIAHAASPPVS